MQKKYRNRRIIAIVGATILIALAIFLNPASYERIYIDFGSSSETTAISSNNSDSPLAQEILEKLEVKGRAPKTGYERTKFYDSWPTESGCNLRQRILKRDFGETAKLSSDNCTVISGSLYEPYTGQELTFTEKTQISKGLQIDHVVALSDAWQKGAQYMTNETRFNIATDPLNLIAVDSSANQQKSDGDAATWLPKNKGFRCQYVARQVAVKHKYGLWVTEAEKDAISRVLSSCPDERIPT
ncbi:HNH endonuclease [Candidatus Saccharibacteria bacterium]|nr:HNH endonuclease [Candidatus Saccharibacteria bacterium]